MVSSIDQSFRGSWQDEYRYGAFFLFPPTDVATVVNRLRARHDPRSAAICGAHVSLGEPLVRPLSDEQVGEVRAELATLTPFDVTYGPLTSFDPHPGVVFAITPVDAFFVLRGAIHSTSIFEGRELKRANRAPHMTIAEFISLDETHDLLAQLADSVPGGTFLCDRVVYAVPDTSFHFERVLTIPLGGST